jgi:hypothetical protein
MRLTHTFAVFLLIPALCFASPAFAQDARVVDSTAMSQALAGRHESERAQRELVRDVLDRTETRSIASRMGLDIEQAQSAVATLSGQELETLAQHAGAVQSAALAGGANTIVISVTTLLLILIIVILLAK